MWDFFEMEGLRRIDDVFYCKTNFVGKKCTCVYRIIPRGEIRDFILKAIELVGSECGEDVTINEIRKKYFKLHKRYRSLRYSPLVPKAYSRKLLEKLNMYENLLTLYGFAYGCPRKLIGKSNFRLDDCVHPYYKLDGMDKEECSMEEILDSKFDIHKLLDKDFITSFATWWVNKDSECWGWNSWAALNEEEFVEMEKAALLREAERENEKKTKIK